MNSVSKNLKVINSDVFAGRDESPAAPSKFYEIPSEIWGDVFSHALDAPFAPALRTTHQLAMTHPNLSAALRLQGPHRKKVELLQKRIELVEAICDAAPQENFLFSMLQLYELLTISKQRELDLQSQGFWKSLHYCIPILPLLNEKPEESHVRIWVEHALQENSSFSPSERLSILESCSRIDMELCSLAPSWLSWLDPEQRLDFVGRSLKDERYLFFLLQAEPSSLTDKEFLLIADYTVCHPLFFEYLDECLLYYRHVCKFLLTNLSRIDVKLIHRLVEASKNYAAHQDAFMLCLLMHQSIIKTNEQEKELIDKAACIFLENLLPLSCLNEYLPFWSQNSKKIFFTLIASRMDEARLFKDRFCLLENVAGLWSHVPLDAKIKLHHIISRCFSTRNLRPFEFLYFYKKVNHADFFNFPRELWQVVTKQASLVDQGTFKRFQMAADLLIKRDISVEEENFFLKHMRDYINFLSRENRIELLQIYHQKALHAEKKNIEILYVCTQSLVKSDPDILSICAAFRKVFDSNKDVAEWLSDFLHLLPKKDAEAVCERVLLLADHDPSYEKSCLALLKYSKRVPRPLRKKLAEYSIHHLKQEFVRNANPRIFELSICLARDDSFWA